MPVIRAFIAIPLPPNIHQYLDEVSRRLQGEIKSRGARWVPVRNIHLTLKFLGDVSTSNVNLLAELLHNEASRASPFEVTVGGVGAFPNTHRPRVIWVGVEAPPALQALQKAIDTETIRLGYPGEDRPFSPHLTLARLNQNASPDEVRQVGASLAACKAGPPVRFTVEAVHLFRSDLQPGGAIYTSLYSIHLTKRGEN
jgi:2'-5' RNA ligase